MSETPQARNREESLKAEIRAIPISERLETARRMIGKMCSEGRPPKMSIPVRAEDEDWFIVQTLIEAKELLAEALTGQAKKGEG